MRPFAQQSYPLKELAARAMSDNGSTRPVLLRVLTDLFVMRSSHSHDEVRQFEEIAMRVVEDAGEAELLHVARALCRHPDAPAEVLEQVVAHGGPAACLLLAECRKLSTMCITTAASVGGPDCAAAVASRMDLDRALVKALAARPELEVSRALARNDAAPLERDIIVSLIGRGRNDAELAQILCARWAYKPEAAPLFLQATSRQRALMLAGLKRQMREAEQISAFMEPRATAATRRIEAAALAQDREGFVQGLSHALELDRNLTVAILEDPEGEPLAIALRAIGVSPEVATRILLFVDPVISHSFGKVSRLTQLVATTSLDVAQIVIQAMRGSAPETSRASHMPIFDQTARPAPSRHLAETALPGQAPRVRGRAEALAQRLNIRH